MTDTPTPGPWIYRNTAGNHDFAVYQESTGRDVALVRDFNEANARLIAAAPEMYAQLEAIDVAITNILQIYGEAALADSLRAKLQIMRDRTRAQLARCSGQA